MNRNISPEIILTDHAGAETLLQVRLPLVIVDEIEVYKFTGTSSGEASGAVISEIVASEAHYLDKETIKNLGVDRFSSFAKTVGGINKKIYPHAGFMPLEIQKDEVNFYGFGGLRLNPVEVPKRVGQDGDQEYIFTPLENRLMKSGIDITGMTLAEKRIVDSMRSRAGVHLNIVSIIKLLEVDHNIAANTEYVARTLSNLLKRNKDGRLPKIHFRVVDGDLRVVWELTEVLTVDVKEFNQQQKSVQGIPMIRER